MLALSSEFALFTWKRTPWNLQRVLTKSPSWRDVSKSKLLPKEKWLFTTQGQELMTANGTVPYDPKEKLWRFFSFLIQNLCWEVSVFTTVFAELYSIWVFPKNLWPKLQIWEIICVKIHGVTQFVTANSLYYRHRQLCVLSKPILFNCSQRIQPLALFKVACIF